VATELVVSAAGTVVVVPVAGEHAAKSSANAGRRRRI
jgi:hypothetical protein